MAESPPQIASPNDLRPESLYYRADITGKVLHQGLLLRNVWEWTVAYNEQGEVSAAKPIAHPLSIIVTQECDLTQDAAQRAAEPERETELSNVLLCKAQLADKARNKRSEFNSKTWKLVQNNKNERFQYLAAVPASIDLAGKGSDPILVDFKSFFCIRTTELYRQIRLSNTANRAQALAALAIPWREHLQSRLAFYHGRIGLPRDHFIPESRRPELPGA